MRIVFHGSNAAAFTEGFAGLLEAPHDIALLPDAVQTQPQRDAYAAAEILVGARFKAGEPHPAGLRLFHSTGAGVDAIDTTALPPGSALCNCFGHEHAIAEYVMAALLLRRIELPRADAELRQGMWNFAASSAETAHRELHGSTIGLLGFGHIGRAIASRARAFGMRVHAANRTPVQDANVDRAWTLDGLAEFMGSADFIVTSLPLLPETAGIVGRAAMAAMRPDGVLVNVGRGGVVDEEALYEALSQRRIGGAVIDTWYQYPASPGAVTRPARLPFHELGNILMTPHMSGWTTGTIDRRRRTMAENVNRLMRGDKLINQVWPG